MVLNLMWLFCGAFIGGLVALFFTAAVSVSKEAERNEELVKENNDLLEEVKTMRAILAEEGKAKTISLVEAVSLIKDKDFALRITYSQWLSFESYADFENKAVILTVKGEQNEQTGA